MEDVELILFTREDLRPEHLRGIRAKIVQFTAPRETLWSDWALPRMIRREALTLFHAPADRGLPLVSSCPRVVTIHNSYERAHWRKLFPSWKQRLWYWKNEMLNFYGADAVLTVSDTARKELGDARIARANKIHRTYLAPSNDFHPKASLMDSTILKTYNIEPPYVLFVGGYDRHKNVGALTEAFDHAGLMGHLLVIVADHQWQFEELRARWKRLGCFSRLRLIEAAAEDIPALYRHAELFVNPSFWESFSFPLVEAMACGTPILCSDRPAMREITGGAALLFQPEDIDELTRLLKQVSGDAALKKELRAQGLRRVRMFSWRATAEDTMNAYRAVVS